MRSNDISVEAELPLAIRLPSEDGNPRWVGWRIWAVDIHRERPGILRLNIFVDPADGRKSPISEVFEVKVKEDGTIASERFIALASACGIRGRIENTRELEGRFFSTRNSGLRTCDFGPLTNALAA